VTGSIAVGAYPWGVAFAPDGATAYGTNHSDDTVSVIARSGQRVFLGPNGKDQGFVIGSDP